MSGPDATSDPKGQMKQTSSQKSRTSATLQVTSESGEEKLSATLLDLDRLTCEIAELTARINVHNLDPRKSEETVLLHIVSLKALDATIVRAEMENENLKTDNSNLCKATTEALTWTKGSRNMHVVIKIGMLIETIFTWLFGMAMKVDKKTLQWANREASHLQYFTRHIPCEWNDRAEVVHCNRILQCGNSIVSPYTPLAVASIWTYNTRFSKTLGLYVTQIVEIQIASQNWRALYSDDDVRTGAKDVLRWCAGLHARIRQSLCDARNGKKRAAKNEFPHFLGSYHLLFGLQALIVEDKVKMVAEMQSVIGWCPISKAWSHQHEFS